MSVLLQRFLSLAVAGVMGMHAAATVHAEDLLTTQMVDEARMWQSKGRTDLAQDIWRRLLITNARNGEALVGLAQVNIQAGQLNEAQVLLSRAARLSPPPSTLAVATAQLRAAQQRAGAKPEAQEQGTRSNSSSSPRQNGGITTGATRSTTLEASPASQPNTAGKPTGSAQTKAVATIRAPSPEPVAPRPVEITITPIPLRTVEAKPSADGNHNPDAVQLQASSQLLANASTPAPAVPKAPQKNKPRPCRPAPTTNPPMPER